MFIILNHPHRLGFRHIINTFYYLERHKSTLSLWQEELTTEVKTKIENRWSESVSGKGNNESRADTYYVLPMFPYPSGNLHMGHVRVYSISDSIARFHKLNGKNVIHPIGWDAFGLPAENAALERNILPNMWTQSNIKTMKKQLLKLGFTFDWSREISTCDPSYYKWTQYIFLKLFEKGLAYQSKANVNWDPVDKTVLADEQVDEFGCSWRSGAKVEKKTLTQWFIKTTKFAQKLYEGLNNESLSSWKDIINLQKHWIGECNGVIVTFKINGRNFDVWTPDPYKFIHGQFIIMNRNHIILQDLCEDITNLKCYNPITESEMPVYVTESNIYPEGKNVYIASVLDEEDLMLAKSLKINVPKTITSIDIDIENKKAVEIANLKNMGGHYVSSKLNDWLISRQRYWGTPIPIVHCEKCGVVAVPYDQLPVVLPENRSTDSRLIGLNKIEEWVNCKCPKCNHNAKRETDTMDTFVDSSWYFYRFLDPHNKTLPFDKEVVRKNIPVDIYIGGKEHAVLHLYYARFMGYFLHSLGWSPSEEPFAELLVQGMIMGQSFKLKSTGKYLPAKDVEKIGEEYVEKSTGDPVSVQWEKMSKSKHNGENPERLLSVYGCDTTRLLILADVPPATSRNWSDATLPGVLNWQNRIWMSMKEFLSCRNNLLLQNTLSEKDYQVLENKIWDARNYFTATATYHFKHTRKISVAISRMQGLTNSLRNKLPPEIIAKSKEFELALATLIIMLSPITPHFCSELWAGLVSAPNRVCESTHLIDWNKDVLEQKWPVVDEQYSLSLLCKVDGADRCDLKIPSPELPRLSEELALELVKKEKRVAKRIRRGIEKTKYENYPGCRAILHIYTKQPIKKKEIADVIV